MTEREYVEALVTGMREQMAEAESQARSLKHPSAARQFMEDQRARSLELLDSLIPPESLQRLHARLRSMAEQSLDEQEEPDDALLNDILELARLAERYGLELAPGMTAAEVEASVRGGSREWFPGQGDWEARLRRSLADDGHADIDAIVERMRTLREHWRSQDPGGADAP